MSSTVGPYISGWSTLSPFGVGRQAFVDAFLAGRAGRLAEPGESDLPGAGYLVEGFDAVRMLGSKGTRTLDRMTLMVVATNDMLLTEHAPTLGRTQDSIGLVLGTSTGSVASIVDFTRDTFVRERPYLVNPAAFPNTVMNGAAGHTAIWHGLRGLNSTVSAGHLTGLAALRYATRMIRRGYASTLLVGSVEELSRPVAWAAHQIREGRPSAGNHARPPLGEGCVMFLVDSPRAAEAHGRDAVAEIIDFEFSVALPADGAAGQAASLAAAIRILLERNKVVPDELWRLSLAQSGDGDLDSTELHAVEDVLADAAGPGRIITVTRQAGNSFSALGAFQVAAVLAAAEGDAKTRLGRLSLITSLGLDGGVACALIRN